MWLALATLAATAMVVKAGGLVTGFDAGFSVPDWPSTYRMNMFLYPLRRMTGGIYYEHTHRLFGTLVGLSAIVMTGYPDEVRARFPDAVVLEKPVAPRALLWFRWAAVATWLTGAWYLMVNSELINAFTLGATSPEGDRYGLSIGIGAWAGTIMLFNVWILIWPNQKKVLGLVEATAEQIASAKSTALMASRTNTMLSIPMLMSMVGAHHGYPV